MKIAIDISQIIYGTGVSTYTKKLVENLLKIDRKNQYILFGSSLRAFGKLKEIQENLSRYKNVEFKFLHCPQSLLTTIFSLPSSNIDKFIGSVDIFHSSDWIQPRVKSPDTKKVTTVHDMIPYLFPVSVHPKILNAHKKRLEKVKKEVDIIIADSQATKEDIIKFLEIPEEKIKVIYLAPSEQFIPQEEEKVQKVLEKYKIKKPYILSVATQEPRKNIQKLLDVFEKILENKPEYHLVLTGKYGWGPGFRSPENVIWTGYVPEEDLLSLYSGARVFAYPSLYEGFGLPILEAMACGAPVVTSNNSSMAEIAKDAAILVDPRSEGQIKKAIEMILDLNMENYQKMVKASVNRAKRFTWEKCAKETLAVYEQLVSQEEEIESGGTKSDSEDAIDESEEQAAPSSKSLTPDS